MEGSYQNNHAAVSKVLHVRDLAAITEANDLRQFLSAFGDVVYVAMMPKFKQALVEMKDADQATAVVNYCQTQPVPIHGAMVSFTYSRSQEIKRLEAQPSPADTYQEHRGENILLLNIMNPLYPITVSVLHTILSPHGNVLRIVIFTKTGTQALVEFESPTSAVQARQHLEGKDIYEGCCTLRISYSRADRLNVRFNNEKSFDFTNPDLPSGEDSLPVLSVHNSNGVGAASGGTQGSMAVLMVYNLPEEGLTCDHVFNLFCLYGNVSRVKILTNKGGAAMVQMFERAQSEQATTHLARLMLASKELNITPSKHPFIADGHCVFVDSNGDTTAGSADANPVCKDYTNSPSNRFLRQSSPVSSKHIYKPTSVLFFSNASPSTTEASLTEFFGGFPIARIQRIKIFAQTASNKRQGLLEFQSVEDAVKAVMWGNNTRIEGYTLKLSFSTNTL